MTSERSPGISVVIPAWKGLQLLRENLPSVQTAVETYSREKGAKGEIIVVDDASQDGTADALSTEFPEVRCVVKPHNEGFAATCNAGFRHCRQPLVALLNSDVRIQPDYLVHKAGHFRDGNVFAVTAKVFEWDRPVFSAGGRLGRFRRGFWRVYRNYDVSPLSGASWIKNHQLLSAYAVGGFSTYDAEKLRELGGFNELLSPFHWEDVDLSYRGWKRGWDIHFEPRSVAFHRVSATIGAHFKREWVEAIAFRNRLLFHWINIHSPSFLLRHLLMLKLLVLTRIFVFDYRFYRSLFQALNRLSAVQHLREKERQKARRSDEEILSLLNHFSRTAPLDIYYNRQEVLDRHPDALGR